MGFTKLVSWIEGAASTKGGSIGKSAVPVSTSIVTTEAIVMDQVVKSPHPYADLPSAAFWSTAVAGTPAAEIANIYTPKVRLTSKMPVATAGSCFAQHVARALGKAGHRVLDTEPPPRGLLADQCARYGYATYSARYGNIYTVRQLLQLAEEATGARRAEEIVWEKEGRFYDALRPAVEPNGLPTAEEVVAQRVHHLAAVREMFSRMQFFVFTLGLTEAWRDKKTGTVFPTAPGVIAGRFDPSRFEFVNFDHAEMVRDFRLFMRLVLDLRGKRPFNVLLTVSPVPLTATASGQHVLAATTLSKARLRSVAATLTESIQRVDYFPSYEIITNPAARGGFFASNLRSVTPAGVDVVMSTFLASHGAASRPVSAETTAPVVPDDEDDVVCEEALLEAFGP
ncbi:GSCFA domain-containing protein [Faunimonas sp. B44]|uniref:GSCFA domain-containing protein n=1 Tax=Faunimonas sp. B44 TaxID=3461493 RepID=UPI004043C73A